MRNLYVVAIGGSGERILRSFVMLLTSGVHLGAERVIPVIIDNDEESYALLQCKDLINYYRSNPRSDDPIEHGNCGAHLLHSKFSENSREWGSFFSTIIEKPLILNEAGKEIGTLKNVIGDIDEDNIFYNNINEELNLLFTENDLEMPLNVGFVGNPNIGSIVLNAKSLQNEEFQNDIIRATSADDGMIVLGSLFGGTGAAGIPLVVNKFHSIAPANRPIIGALALLPYFTLKGDDSADVIDVSRWDVNSDSFETKTRAALMYYDSYMKNQVDFQYYVGDSDAKDAFDHNVGGKKQNNRAHLVEVMSAMSIVDFSKQTTHGNVTYKIPVWGFDANGTGGVLTNISGITNSDIKKSVAKFQMMKVLFQNHNFLPFLSNNNQSFAYALGIDNVIIHSVGVANGYQNFPLAYGVNKLIQEWEKWWKELSDKNANRKFNFFKDVQASTDNNITTQFYSSENGDYGIAKTREKIVHHIFGKETHEIVISPADVGECLRKAFEKYKKNHSVTNIKSEHKLGILFKIISDALDTVISDNCITM